MGEALQISGDKPPDTTEALLNGTIKMVPSKEWNISSSTPDTTARMLGRAGLIEYAQQHPRKPEEALRQLHEVLA